MARKKSAAKKAAGKSARRKPAKKATARKPARKRAAVRRTGPGATSKRPKRAPAPARVAARKPAPAPPRPSLTAHEDGRQRCAWARLTNPLYLAYHDHEWGVPLHDEHRLFEMIVLEGAQAGLAWETILNKREHYRRAFERFDPQVVARYGDREVARLLADAGIVRNRLKIAAAIANARAFLNVQEQFGSFDAYQWRFVDGTPVQNAFRSLRDIPPRTPLSDAYSKDLRQRGFRFVGSTIIYAHMQAVGMVNDHLVDCFRWPELTGAPVPALVP
jgi:DNA-3-methyladenine glycosylase I